MDICENNTLVSESNIFICCFGRLGVNYDEVRKNIKIVKLYPFSSKKKRMSTVIPSDDGYRLYCKGASEVILDKCNQVLDENGNPIELSEKQKQDLGKQIEDWAAQVT